MQGLAYGHCKWNQQTTHLDDFLHSFPQRLHEQANALFIKCDDISAFFASFRFFEALSY